LVALINLLNNNRSKSMVESLRKCKVSILDEPYVLITDESDEHVQKAALLVDSYMREIASKIQLTDSKKIAVLAALKIASSAITCQRQLVKQQEYSEKLIDLVQKEIQ